MQSTHVVQAPNNHLPIIHRNYWHVRTESYVRVTSMMLGYVQYSGERVNGEVRKESWREVLSSIAPRDLIRSATLRGMFIIEGLRLDPVLADSGADSRLLAQWDRGCLELIDQAAPYGEVLARLEAEVSAVTEDFPGVYAYEVSSPFGFWLYKNIHETNDFPSKDQCLAQISQLAKAFFKTSDDEATKALGVVDAVLIS